jgi:hypothetical protein
MLPPWARSRVAKEGSSAPAASEPRGALDRGVWVVLRCDWRRLRRRPRHLGWRQADTHNDPVPVTLAGDPASAGICSSPAFNLSDCLIAGHQLRILPIERRKISCAMSLPRDLWPGPGSWQIGPPPGEKRAERRLASPEASRNVAPPRVTLLRRMSSRLRGTHRRADRR